MMMVDLWWTTFSYHFLSTVHQRPRGRNTPSSGCKYNYIAKEPRRGSSLEQEETQCSIRSSTQPLQCSGVLFLRNPEQNFFSRTAIRTNGKTSSANSALSVYTFSDRKRERCSWKEMYIVKGWRSSCNRAMLWQLSFVV